MRDEGLRPHKLRHTYRLMCIIPSRFRQLSRSKDVSGRLRSTSMFPLEGGVCVSGDGQRLRRFIISGEVLRVRRWSLIVRRGSPLANLPVSLLQPPRLRDVIGASANAEMSPEVGT